MTSLPRYATAISPSRRRAGCSESRSVPNAALFPTRLRHTVSRFRHTAVGVSSASRELKAQIAHVYARLVWRSRGGGGGDDSYPASATSSVAKSPSESPVTPARCATRPATKMYIQKAVTAITPITILSHHGIAEPVT